MSQDRVFLKTGGSHEKPKIRDSVYQADKVDNYPKPAEQTKSYTPPEKGMYSTSLMFAASHPVDKKTYIGWSTEVRAGYDQAVKNCNRVHDINPIWQGRCGHIWYRDQENDDECPRCGLNRLVAVLQSTIEGQTVLLREKSDLIDFVKTQLAEQRTGQSNRRDDFREFESLEAAVLFADGYSLATENRLEPFRILDNRIVLFDTSNPRLPVLRTDGKFR